MSETTITAHSTGRPLRTLAAGMHRLPGFYPALGIAGLLFLWWVGGRIVAGDPAMFAFAGFAPGPSLAAFWDLMVTGSFLDSALPSLYRVGLGLAWAIALGMPLGILVGYFPVAQAATHVPFQFLRMVSPLAWMPLAVMAFATWDEAIIFLIAIAAIWPILFSTAHGVRRIDPDWFKVARNLGASTPQMIRRIVLPAVAQEIFAGIRLAVGVAWIVLVPAEYLGVTSGLGYAINDARDTLDYPRLMSIVLLIGLIGYLLDAVCVRLIRRFSWQPEH